MKINNENLNKIKNIQLKTEVERYVQIYDNFLEAVKKSGVEISSENHEPYKKELLNKLEAYGAQIRNSGKSVLLNAISPSCEDCRKGVGSATYIISLACNRDCFFCANKNQMDYEEGIKKVYNVIDDFKRDFAYYKTMTSAALTGGEPLLFVDECVEFIKTVKKISPKTQTRIYTNGDLVTPEILEKLEKAGLDEVRFGIKTEDDGSVGDEILKLIEEAVKYIPRVMVEMPVTPGTLDKMKELLIKLNDLKIFGINILEFLYPWANPSEYNKHKYQIKNRPYEVLYEYSYAGGLPVAGSEIECLELMLFCAEAKINMGVHYCSLENKLTAEIYGLNSAIKPASTEYFSDKDFFIKTVRCYGEKSAEVKNILDKNSCPDYIYNKSEGYLEFSPIYIKYLKETDIELALSYLAADVDEQGRQVIRELQIDVITPTSVAINEI